MEIFLRSLCGFNKALNHCCVYVLCIKSMPLALRSTNNAPYAELSPFDICGKLLPANAKHLWQILKVVLDFYNNTRESVCFFLNKRSTEVKNSHDPI